MIQVIMIQVIMIHIHIVGMKVNGEIVMQLLIGETGENVVKVVDDEQKQEIVIIQVLEQKLK